MQNAGILYDLRRSQILQFMLCKYHYEYSKLNNYSQHAAGPWMAKQRYGHYSNQPEWFAQTYIFPRVFVHTKKQNKNKKRKSMYRCVHSYTFCRESFCLIILRSCQNYTQAAEAGDVVSPLKFSVRGTFPLKFRGGRKIGETK